jgi:hypothetical protein
MPCSETTSARQTLVLLLDVCVFSVIVAVNAEIEKKHVSCSGILFTKLVCTHPLAQLTSHTYGAGLHNGNLRGLSFAALQPARPIFLGGTFGYP